MADRNISKITLDGTTYQIKDTTARQGLNNIPTKVSQLQNDSGYLTEHQDLSEYAKSVSLIDSASQAQANLTPAEILQAVNDRKILMAIGGVCTLMNIDKTQAVVHRQYNDSNIVAKITINSDKSYAIELVTLAKNDDLIAHTENDTVHISDNERATWNNKAECLNLISPDLTTALYTPLEIISAMSNGNVILMAVGGVCNVVNYNIQNSPNYVVLQRQFNSIKQIVQITIYEDKTFNFVPLELATVKTFSGTLGTFYSSANSLYYYQNVDFPEVTADDEPIIDLITTVDGFEKEQEEWNKIFKAETNNGYITFYVSERTTIPLNFSVKVVK